MSLCCDACPRHGPGPHTFCSSCYGILCFSGFFDFSDITGIRIRRRIDWHMIASQIGQAILLNLDLTSKSKFSTAMYALFCSSDHASDLNLDDPMQLSLGPRLGSTHSSNNSLCS